MKLATIQDLIDDIKSIDDKGKHPRLIPFQLHSIIYAINNAFNSSLVSSVNPHVIEALENYMKQRWEQEGFDR